MSVTEKPLKGIGYLVNAAALVIVIAGIKAAASLLVPILLSAFVAVAATVPLRWLRRKGAPAWLASLLTIFTVIVSAVLLVNMVGVSIRDFSAALPQYTTNLQNLLGSVLAWLNSLGMDLSPDLVKDYFDPGKAVGLFSSLLTGLGNTLTDSAFIAMTTVFMLLESVDLPQKIKVAFASNQRPQEAATELMESLNNYLAMKTLLSLLTGVCVAIWLAIVGVDYAILWGVLAFALNYVPNIGSIIAAVPAVMLALLQLGLSGLIFSSIGFLVVNLVVGSVLEPRLMGRSLGLSTLIVFISLVFWGWVLGPVGMLLSVPLTMIAKIILESHEETRWAAILMEPVRQVRQEAVEKEKDGGDN
ncbi:AI-2E family transporter [Dethiosulfatarculus sandiegensis]|uniref:AI-2E family transporter n=1 Tax=Dethiosulfatarculus sandiegensis TaxID=1429043 RepID=A0A0D2JU96_9BACT|nr:AI-2E family transporter [Dethiosulfatarculus sandiegensis]KIX13035.1 hypothetical protein X474_15840 [Dethiosulfatarculus sandiegensis]